MKITIKKGWLEVTRGNRLYFAMHPARRVIWRSFDGAKCHAIDFAWFNKEENA